MVLIWLDTWYQYWADASVALIKSRMETFWYWLTQVHSEKWLLKRERERETTRSSIMCQCLLLATIISVTTQLGQLLYLSLSFSVLSKFGLL